MFGILDYFKIGAGIAVGVMVYHLYALSIGYPAAARDAKAGMVTKFERDVLASQLAEERRRAQEAAQISEEYRKRADAAQRANAEAQDKLEKAIAEDTGTDSPNWSAADFLWLCEHGQPRYCSR
ncbi:MULTISPECIES: hypothetical protein [unclassified Rhizobium]|uniref:hypothetical protein n=1 Tax=unclassified Rhizobium TaxID=2613769 RepID=UPI001130E22E|nr:MULTISPECIES: hypothetical protein [unclassified Rhizobium]